MRCDEDELKRNSRSELIRHVNFTESEISGIFGEADLNHIETAAEPPVEFERRVRSWLRMNAGGAPNTCKSNG